MYREGVREGVQRVGNRGGVNMGERGCGEGLKEKRECK